MTQEEKQLLIKDLSARLPYKPMVHVKWSYRETDGKLKNKEADRKLDINDIYSICDIKPYLRSMSNMSKEEEEELRLLKNQLVDCNENNEIKFYGIINEIHKLYLFHHIDFMGLIPKGLAIEAPKGMYKNE